MQSTDDRIIVKCRKYRNWAKSITTEIDFIRNPGCDDEPDRGIKMIITIPHTQFRSVCGGEFNQNFFSCTSHISGCKHSLRDRDIMEDIERSSVPTGGGRLGDYRCDSPWPLVQSAVKAMKEKHGDNIEFVLWSGYVFFFFFFLLAVGRVANEWARQRRTRSSFILRPPRRRRRTRAYTFRFTRILYYNKFPKRKFSDDGAARPRAGFCITDAPYTAPLTQSGGRIVFGGHKDVSYNTIPTFFFFFAFFTFLLRILK